ncbi:MAG: hypothetical protein AAGA81_05845 [Acidobacteriota bacterium]
MQQPPRRPPRGLRELWRRWVDAVGLQSVLFAVLTVISALVLLGMTWYLFPEVFR